MKMISRHFGTYFGIWLIGYGVGSLINSAFHSVNTFHYALTAACFVVSLYLYRNLPSPLVVGQLIFCLGLPTGLVVGALTPWYESWEKGPPTYEAVPFLYNGVVFLITGLIVGLTVLEVLDYTRD